MTFLFADSPEFGTILASQGLSLKFPVTENYLLHYKHPLQYLEHTATSLKTNQTKPQT